jgi:hypothetical protein
MCWPLAPHSLTVYSTLYLYPCTRASQPAPIPRDVQKRMFGISHTYENVCHIRMRSVCVCIRMRKTGAFHKGRFTPYV